MAELETNWLMEIIAVLLRQFENLTLEYNHTEDSNVFIEALQSLKNQLNVLKKNLNGKDFLDLWRSVADRLDRFICGSILGGDVKFSKKQSNEFGTDMQALFLVFQPFCARPEAFFPCIRDILKLLAMSGEEVKHLLVGKKSEKYMQSYGISHLRFDQVEKTLRKLKF